MVARLMEKRNPIMKSGRVLNFIVGRRDGVRVYVYLENSSKK